MSNEKASLRRISKRRRLGLRNDTNQNKQRWILSYADFITLLFAFFVALYSISLKNQGDSKLLTETLEGVMQAVQLSVQPINIGKVTTGKAEDEAFQELTPDRGSDPSPSPQQNIQTVVDKKLQVVQELNQMILTHLGEYQQNGLISINESELWIEIELKAGLLFSSGEFELTNEAVAVLMSISEVLKRYSYPIVVEGHTDNLPVSSNKYTSNWQLSSARASSVVDELVNGGINPQLIAVLGLSSEKPKVRNSNDFSRARNRRVTLKIGKQEAEKLYNYLFE
ncbi:flagellar motor protein [Marinomonas sp. MED121]|uniref:OmpA family protein n=1 Tax=Marinomonas sp. MED121 TaxID=314277 RepID=UPI0000690367|nr:OmpA family protein [Marinomonas sp. MED121]EAQ66205.1 flagellar motor protein [Marinomonas sp. MED121]